jgi:hypothetical protein
MERVEWTKVKYNHIRNSSRNPMNNNLEINNKKQDCKIGTAGGQYLREGGGRMK